jgi:hypothetical protein
MNPRQIVILVAAVFFLVGSILPIRSLRNMFRYCAALECGSSLQIWVRFGSGTPGQKNSLEDQERAVSTVEIQ